MIRRRFSLKLVLLISLAFLIPVTTALVTLKLSSNATLTRFNEAIKGSDASRIKLLEEIFPKGYPDIDAEAIFHMLQKYEQRRTFGLFTSFLVISFVLAAVVMLLSILILKRAVLSLGDLSKAATQVGNGNLDINLKTRSHDEFSNVAAAFTKMAKKIKETTVSRDFYNHVLERMPVAVFTIDEDGCVITWNPQAELITGYSEPEMIGCNSEQSPLIKLLSSHEGKRGEAIIKTKNGSTRIVSVESERAWSRSGINTIVTFIDVTEEKEIEKQLVLAKERAEEASRLRTEFLANMSHEIRTPLNGILGMTDILLGEEKDEERRSMLSTIQQCGKRLLHLINEILELSKLEAGRERIKKHPEDLTFIINSAIASVDASFRKKHINFSVHIDNHLPSTIITDADKLVRILTNLLSNSIKYTDAGFISLSAAPYSGNRPGNIVFLVEDSGRGIKSERLKYLFESFTQVDDYMTSQDGTGLGLAISKKLVELLGGEIWVESEQGKGTKVSFTIQAAAEEEATETV